MSQIIFSNSQIPAAKFYVTATDRFMSGWGPSKGKMNRCIFPCNSLREVHKVRRRLEARPEFSNVRLCEKVPRLRPQNVYSLFDPREAPYFYGRSF